MIALTSSVYAAGHGYAWSTPPDNRRNALLADALATRPDFADEKTISAGVVVRDNTAAAFTIRRAPHWDADGRDSDYAAFAFVPCAEAGAIDFAELLKDAFFATPTHTPRATLVYDGPASAAFPVDAPGRLLCHNSLDNFDLRTLGALLAHYGAKADRWTYTQGTLTTSPWHR